MDTGEREMQGRANRLSSANQMQEQEEQICTSNPPRTWKNTSRIQKEDNDGFQTTQARRQKIQHHNVRQEVVGRSNPRQDFRPARNQIIRNQFNNRNQIIRNQSLQQNEIIKTNQNNQNYNQSFNNHGFLHQQFPDPIRSQMQTNNQLLGAKQKSHLWYDDPTKRMVTKAIKKAIPKNQSLLPKQLAELSRLQDSANTYYNAKTDQRLEYKHLQQDEFEEADFDEVKELVESYLDQENDETTQKVLWSFHNNLAEKVSGLIKVVQFIDFRQRMTQILETGDFDLEGQQQERNRAMINETWNLMYQIIHEAGNQITDPHTGKRIMPLTQAEVCSNLALLHGKIVTKEYAEQQNNYNHECTTCYIKFNNQIELQQHYKTSKHQTNVLNHLPEEELKIRMGNAYVNSAMQKMYNCTNCKQLIDGSDSHDCQGLLKIYASSHHIRSPIRNENGLIIPVESDDEDIVEQKIFQEDIQEVGIPLRAKTKQVGIQSRKMRTLIKEIFKDNFDERKQANRNHHILQNWVTVNSRQGQKLIENLRNVNDEFRHETLVNKVQKDNFTKDRVLRIITHNINGNKFSGEENLSIGTKKGFIQYESATWEADVIVLTETKHLQDDTGFFPLKYFEKYQTHPRPHFINGNRNIRRDGVQIYVKRSTKSHMRHILEQHLVAIEINLSDVNFHIIGIYIPTQKKEHENLKEKIIEKIFEYVFATLQFDPHANIIVTGDFNHDEQIKNALKLCGLHSTFNQQVTHNKGGKLDDLLTNCIVSRQTLSQIKAGLTFHDHAVLKANINPKYIQNQQEYGKQPAEKLKGKELRDKIATHDIARLMLDPRWPTEPISKLIDPILITKNKNWNSRSDKISALIQLQQDPHTDDQIATSTFLIKNEAKIAKLNKALKENDIKTFCQISNQIVPFKDNSAYVAGIIDNQNNPILLQTDMDQIMFQYLSQLYNSSSFIQVQPNRQTLKRPIPQSVIGGLIMQLNHEKAIGPGLTNLSWVAAITPVTEMEPDPTAARVTQILAYDKVINLIDSIVNKGAPIPDYFKQHSLIYLSKTGKSIVKPEDIRIIQIQDHLAKLLESTIYYRLDEIGRVCRRFKSNNPKQNLGFLDCHASQSGFKQGSGTEKNILQLLNWMQTDTKENRQGGIIFVDIKKAFDSINNNLLFKILREKAQERQIEDESALIEILIEYLQGTKLVISEQLHVIQNFGVAQGGKFSPILFNIVFDWIIDQIPTLKFLAECGDLILYADDMAIHFSTPTQLEAVIQGLERMSIHNLQINTTKSQIMINTQYQKAIFNNNPPQSLLGLPLVEEYKFLGLKINRDLQKTKNTIASQCEKIAKYTIAKLAQRKLPQDARRILYQMLLRSILTYQLQHLYALKLINAEWVDKLETRLITVAKLPQLGSKATIFQNGIIESIGPISEQLENLIIKCNLRPHLQLGKTAFYIAAKFTLEDEIKLRGTVNTFCSFINKKEIPKQLLQKVAPYISDRLDDWPNYFYCNKHRSIIHRDHLHTCDLLWEDTKFYNDKESRSIQMKQHLDFKRSNSHLPNDALTTETINASMDLMQVHANLSKYRAQGRIIQVYHWTEKQDSKNKQESQALQLADEILSEQTYDDAVLTAQKLADLQTNFLNTKLQLETLKTTPKTRKHIKHFVSYMAAAVARETEREAIKSNPHLWQQRRDATNYIRQRTMQIVANPKLEFITNTQIQQASTNEEQINQLNLKIKQDEIRKQYTERMQAINTWNTRKKILVTQMKQAEQYKQEQNNKDNQNEHTDIQMTNEHETKQSIHTEQQEEEQKWEPDNQPIQYNTFQLKDKKIQKRIISEIENVNSNRPIKTTNKNTLTQTQKLPPTTVSDAQKIVKHNSVYGFASNSIVLDKPQNPPKTVQAQQPSMLRKKKDNPFKKEENSKVTFNPNYAHTLNNTSLKFNNKAVEDYGIIPNENNKGRRQHEINGKIVFDLTDEEIALMKTQRQELIDLELGIAASIEHSKAEAAKIQIALQQNKNDNLQYNLDNINKNIESQSKTKMQYQDSIKTTSEILNNHAQKAKPLPKQSHSNNIDLTQSSDEEMDSTLANAYKPLPMKNNVKPRVGKGNQRQQPHK